MNRKSMDIVACVTCYYAHHNGGTDDLDMDDVMVEPWGVWDSSPEVEGYSVLDKTASPCLSCNPDGDSDGSMEYEGDPDCESCYGLGYTDMPTNFSSEDCGACYDGRAGARYSMRVEWTSTY